MESQDSPHGSSEKRREEEKQTKGRDEEERCDEDEGRSEEDGRKMKNHHVTSGIDNIAPKTTVFLQIVTKI